MTVLILATQRREDELSNRHEQLTLELAMLSEQKAAKLSRCWKSCARTIPRSEIGLTRRRPQCSRRQIRPQFLVRFLDSYTQDLSKRSVELIQQIRAGTPGWDKQLNQFYRAAIACFTD